MPTEAQKPAESHLPRLRVLVVDDDPDVRHVLCANLGRRGHDAVGTGTMKEALLVLAASHIDVLVTDVLLPDGDGLDLLNHVTGRSPAIRCIVVTGGGRYFGPDYFRRIGEALGARVLQKPFDRQVFIDAVECPAAVVARG